MRKGQEKAVAIVLAVVIMAVQAARAETEVLAGRHRIVYDIVSVSGVEEIRDYENNSYRIKVLQKPDPYTVQLLVETKLDPLVSKALYPIQDLTPELRTFLAAEERIQAGHPLIQSRAAQITAGATTVLEAAERISDWVRDYLTYDAGPSVKQDALSVLQTGRGSCVGYSNLTVALARSAGIPARYVGGYLPMGYDWGISKNYWGVKTSGGGYHAWTEIYYPDAGWAFTDGEYSKNFVDPYHITRYISGLYGQQNQIGEATLNVDSGVTYTVVEEENTTFPIDEYSSPKNRILGRATRMQQSATVYGLVKDSLGNLVESGKVILWKGSRGEVTRFNRNRFAVSGLPAGTHRLTIEADGYSKYDFEARVADREVVRRDIQLKVGARVVVEVTPKPPRAALSDSEVFLWKGSKGTGQVFDDDGRLIVTGMEPDTDYNLTVAIPGFALAEQPLNVKSGDQKTIQLGLKPGAVVSGRLTGPSGSALQSARVILWRGAVGTPKPVGPDGTFRLIGVAPGTHKISARAEGFRDWSQQIELPAGQTQHRLDIELERK